MTPDIQLIAVEPANQPAYTLVLCFDDEAETAKLFEQSVGQGTAKTLLRHFRSGFISGKYKDHNIVPSDTGDTWTLVLGLGKRDQAERNYRFEDRVRSVLAIAGRYFRRRGVRSIVVNDLKGLGIPTERLGQLIAD